MKPISKMRALNEATLETSPVLTGKDYWYYMDKLKKERKFPTYHQAREHRAQSIAENAARRYLESRGLPRRLLVQGNMKGTTAARLRILLDALPEHIRKNF